VSAACPFSTAEDVAEAIQFGKAVFQEWRLTTIKQRTAIMLKFHSLVNEHAQELARVHLHHYSVTSLTFCLILS
jgi:malonate-semialdehyde dehydrogenase (acetylating) / methylmalonate-semialdehyde dehydrogenase